MSGRPTIIDVAERAGVSKSTVSLVLQNSPTVREETREQVRAAMAEIGYVYNRTAANLRSSGAGLIGLVINDLRNPFFTEFATSLQMALSAKGYSAVVANTDEDPKLQTQVIGAMIEHGVSFIIISPCYGGGGEGFDSIARAGIPALQVLRRVDSRKDIFPFAAPDSRSGGRIATEHLLSGRQGRVAFVGGIEGSSVLQERMSGYLDAVEAAGLSPLVIAGRASRAFGREMARRLQQDHPNVDAVMCFNDLVALGLLSGCAEVGRKVGGDGLRIVGFDDIEECSQTWPALSSVRCDIAGFGRMIAGTVLDWLLSGKVPAEEVRTPVALMVRQSSAVAQ